MQPDTARNDFYCTVSVRIQAYCLYIETVEIRQTNSSVSLIATRSILPRLSFPILLDILMALAYKLSM